MSNKDWGPLGRRKRSASGVVGEAVFTTEALWVPMRGRFPVKIREGLGTSVSGNAPSCTPWYFGIRFAAASINSLITYYVVKALYANCNATLTIRNRCVTQVTSTITTQRSRVARFTASPQAVHGFPILSRRFPTRIDRPDDLDVPPGYISQTDSFP